MLTIIDSIPLLYDPESWDQILPEDIADYTVISNKDSLKMLGWERVDTVTYLFTKEYRNRPDSIKKIPALTQMDRKDGVWCLHGTPYTGKYIKFYSNGKIQSEGRLLNGWLDGELIVYYKNGIRKSVTHFESGTVHGLSEQYYKNGRVRATGAFNQGRTNGLAKSFFINGQIRLEIKLKRATRYDTSIIYFSTGKIKQMKTWKPGQYQLTKKEEALSFHTGWFYSHLREGNLKAANKDFYEIWLIDSASVDTYFKEGLLLAREFRFDEAIAQFDKALAIEPLMQEALDQRVLARLKRFKFSSKKIPVKDRRELPVILEDLIVLPEDEKAQVCRDLLLADDLDSGVVYSNKAIPQTLVDHCRNKNGR